MWNLFGAEPPTMPRFRSIGGTSAGSEFRFIYVTFPSNLGIIKADLRRILVDLVRFSSFLITRFHSDCESSPSRRFLGRGSGRYKDDRGDAMLPDPDSCPLSLVPCHLPQFPLLIHMYISDLVYIAWHTSRLAPKNDHPCRVTNPCGDARCASFQTKD